MNRKEIMKMVDHTLLTQTATWEEIRQVCDEGMKYETASVCIPSFFVKKAADYVQGKLKICTVIGFPNGYQTKAVKMAETKDALENGADEIDMVIHIGDVKEGKFDEILLEIKEIKEICGEHILKVIIETCLLSEDEKIKMCQVVSESGADYIKTSTGFSTSGATFEDIALFKEKVASHVKIKAAGGISSFQDAEEFVRLGANRLGTSRLVKILEKQDINKEQKDNQIIREMIQKAIEARKKSYSPYSHFQVGACLQSTDGKLYTGYNIENASFSVTNCAERTAFFHAISQSEIAAGQMSQKGTFQDEDSASETVTLEKGFNRIVIVGGKENGKLEWCPPCGACLQVMMEFCNPEEFEIILAISMDEYKIYTLKQLLPLGFGKENVK